MRTDDSVSILTHAAAVSQSAYCRKPLRRFLRFTREASLSDRVLKPLHRCKGVGGRHAEISIAAERVRKLTVLPFHPPGSNSEDAEFRREEATSAVSSHAKH